LEDEEMRNRLNVDLEDHEINGYKVVKVTTSTFPEVMSEVVDPEFTTVSYAVLRTDRMNSFWVGRVINGGWSCSFKDGPLVAGAEAWHTPGDAIIAGAMMNRKAEL
jgi:hypothetical protein